MAKALRTFSRITGIRPTWAQREAMLRMINSGWHAEDAAACIAETV